MPSNPLLFVIGDCSLVYPILTQGQRQLPQADWFLTDSISVVLRYQRESLTSLSQSVMLVVYQGSVQKIPSFASSLSQFEEKAKDEAIESVVGKARITRIPARLSGLITPCYIVLLKFTLCCINSNSFST